MISRAEPFELTFSSGRKRALDLLELTKPRLVLMVLISTCVGFYLGSGETLSYFRLIDTLIGTALAAGGTLALNQLIERNSDALMERTRRRPLPEGRVQPVEALAVGVGLTAAGLALLAGTINVLSAVVTGLIVGSYLFIYTPLKQKSSLCGLVGAIPGAFPPMIGWAAARGDLALGSWVLFAIMFCWQVPHTLAIARIYRADFARAKIRFLPVIDEEGSRTGRHAVGYLAALLVVSLLPTLLGLTGVVYGAVALFLGVAFLLCGVGLAAARTAAAARRLLLASLIYLPVLLLVMAVDRITL
ncbi:MAG TPA: heme o synthase [Candidatus Binatia bacterium]